MPGETTREGTDCATNKIYDHIDRIRATNGLRRQAEDRALVTVHSGLDPDIEHDDAEREHCERVFSQREDDKGACREKGADAVKPAPRWSVRRPASGALKAPAAPRSPKSQAT
jgi:hypothetical protein